MARERDVERIRMVVTGGGLQPLDQRDREVIGRHPLGATVEVSVFRRWNPAYMALLRAVVADVVENTDFPTADALWDHLKVRAGHHEAMHTLKGEITVTPRSAAELDHDQLIEFGATALLLLATEIIPGLDVDALLRRRARTMRKYEDRE